MATNKVRAASIAALIVAAAALGVAGWYGCQGGTNGTGPGVGEPALKVGFIMNGPANDAGFNQSHEDGRKHLEAAFPGKVKTTLLENVPETPDAVRAMERLIADGTNVIVSTSFGYQDSIVDVANRHTDVKFLQAFGFKHAPNVASYSARMYEVWYLMGIAAGRKTVTGKLGVVAAFPVPPLKWQINVYAIGARSVRPDTTVTVTYINHWSDPVKSAEAGDALMNQGNDVMCGFLDNSVGLARAVERNGKAWLIGHNSDLSSFAPTRHLVGTRWVWGKLYEDEVRAMQAGTWKGGGDHSGGLKEGYIGMTEFSAAVPEPVRAEIGKAKEEIANGRLHVYTGPLKDNTGAIRVPAGKVLTHEVILAIDWLVEGVR